MFIAKEGNEMIIVTTIQVNADEVLDIVGARYCIRTGKLYTTKGMRVSFVEEQAIKKRIKKYLGTLGYPTSDHRVSIKLFEEGNQKSNVYPKKTVSALVTITEYTGKVGKTHGRGTS